MSELKELDEQIEFTLANDKLEEGLKYSEKCLHISKTLENEDLIEKYQFISERIQKRIRTVEEEQSKSLAEIMELEQKITIERENNNLDVALEFCEKIIQLSLIFFKLYIM